MPSRPDATDVLRINFTGVRREEARRMFRSSERLVREDIRFLVEAIGEAAVFMLHERAPERTGRLKEGIRVTGQSRSVGRPAVRVGVEAKSDTGFDYLNVTRFGRKAVVATSGFGSARPVENYKHEGPGAQKRPFRARSLVFEPGPPGTGFIARRRVKAYRPGRDWVRSAEGPIRRMGDREFDQIAQDIEDAISRRNFLSRRSVRTDVKPRRTTTNVTTRTGRYR